MALDLDKFNVLVGPNNSGKSNLMEAVMFVLDAMKGNPWDSINRRGGLPKVIFYGAQADANIQMVAAFDSNGKDKWDYSMRLGGQSYGESGATNIARAYANTTRWHYYRFVPSHMRNPGGIAPQRDLAEDGSNLSTVLHYLWNDRHKSFQEIEGLLRAAVPEIEHIATPIVGGNATQAAIKERYFGKSFTTDMMSDGTLSLLAHLVALFGPEPPSLACFEESENFVHPHIIEHLIDIMKKGPAQVIISSHSPTFLNFVRPEELIIVSKRDGRTRCERLEQPDKYRDQPLGELWFTGELGGVP